MDSAPARRNQTSNKFSKAQTFVNKRRNSEIRIAQIEKETASFDAAVLHYKANRVYQNLFEDEIPKCPCCNLPTVLLIYFCYFKIGVLYPLCCDIRNVDQFGSGHPLYFIFVKMCIYLNLIIFCFSGAYNIISNVLSEDCSIPNDDYCPKNYITMFALPSKRDSDDLLLIQQILNALLVVSMLAFFQYMRWKMRVIDTTIDDQTITPSDYTALITGIAHDATDEKIKSWIKDEIMRGLENVEISKIFRVYKITHLLTLFHKRHTLIERLKKDDHDEILRRVYKNELEQVNFSINNAKKKENLEKADCVFVAFKTPVQMRAFVNVFRKSFLEKWFSIFQKTKRRFYGLNVHCERAPEPGDVDWHMISYSDGDKKWKKRLTTAGAILLVVCGFFLVVTINLFQIKQADSNPGSAWVTVLSVLSSLLIFLLNLLLDKVVSWLTNMEMNSTLTVWETSYATKLSIAQFVNSCFTTLVAKLFVGGVFNEQYPILKKLQDIQFYANAGVMENIYYLFIINLALIPLLSLIDPANIVKGLWIIKLNLRRTRDGMSQQELNELYEGPKLIVAQKYAVVIKSMLFISFYAPALPFAIILNFFTLFGMYWADKYSFLRVAKRPHFMGSDLAFVMIDYLEFAAFMFSAGNIFFSYTMKNSLGEDSYINESLLFLPLCLSLINIIFPMRLLNEKLFRVDSTYTDELPYEEAKLKHFFNNYDTENPVTHEEARKKFDIIKSSVLWMAKGKSMNNLLGAVHEHSNKKVQTLIEIGRSNTKKKSIIRTKTEDKDENLTIQDSPEQVYRNDVRRASRLEPLIVDKRNFIIENQNIVMMDGRSNAKKKTLALSRLQDLEMGSIRSIRDNHSKTPTMIPKFMQNNIVRDMNNKTKRKTEKFGSLEHIPIQLQLSNNKTGSASSLQKHGSSSSIMDGGNLKIPSMNKLERSGYDNNESGGNKQKSQNLDEKPSKLSSGNAFKKILKDKGMVKDQPRLIDVLSIYSNMKQVTDKMKPIPNNAYKGKKPTIIAKGNYDTYSQAPKDKTPKSKVTFDSFSNIMSPKSGKLKSLGDENYSINIKKHSSTRNDPQHIEKISLVSSDEMAEDDKAYNLNLNSLSDMLDDSLMREVIAAEAGLNSEEHSYSDDDKHIYGDEVEHEQEEEHEEYYDQNHYRNNNYLHNDDHIEEEEDQEYLEDEEDNAPQTHRLNYKIENSKIEQVAEEDEDEKSSTKKLTEPEENFVVKTPTGNKINLNPEEPSSGKGGAITQSATQREKSSASDTDNTVVKMEEIMFDADDDGNDN